MDSAFSLIKNKEISAKSAEYRQNLDEQMVCPACYEPVFKKKLWVASKNDKTHFFSHYAGDQETCPERTSGEGGYENGKDKYSQLQRLEIFNKFFRENILRAFKKIIGIQSFNRLESTLEFSERICVEKLNINELAKLERDLIDFLDQPLSSSIDSSLSGLEDALLPIYWHFKSNYGESNLRFITCIALLMTFYKENQHLENILEKKTLKNKHNLSPLLAGNAVLLLANSSYIDWHGSTTPIKNFLKPPIKRTESKKKTNTKVKRIAKSPKLTAGYFACIYCKKIHYFEFQKYKECNACHRWFYTDPQNKLRNLKESVRVDSEPSLDKKSKKENARWIYCIDCNKQYFSENKTPCPHQINASNLKSKPKEEPKQLMHCSKCKANYMGLKDACPYCSKNQSTQLKKCRDCGKGLIKNALLPSKAGQTWRKCNFCNLNFEYSNF